MQGVKSKYAISGGEILAFKTTVKKMSERAFALDTNIIAFLETHFAKKEALFGNKSQGIQMLYCMNEQFKPIRMAPGMDFVNQAKELLFSPNIDYYITANSFCKCHPRDIGNLFGLHNIVVDCDMHVEGHSASYFMDACKYLTEDLREYLREFAPKIPVPNSIVYSGRGLQLWWSCLPLRKEYADCYEFLQDKFINVIKSFLQCNPQYKEFNVDEGASRNKVGLFRLPGTYNTKIGVQTFVYLIDDTIHDMFAMRKQVSTPADYASNLRRCNLPYVDDNGKGFAAYAKKRAHAIETLVNLRKRDVYGQRDFILWLYHNECAKFMDQQSAYDAMGALNNTFLYPEKASRLAHIISGTNKRGNIYDENGGYAITNARIIDILDISREEQDAIGLHPVEPRIGTSWGTPNKTRDAQNREKKRKKRLLEVSIIKRIVAGMKLKEAAALFKRSYDTIRRIVKDWKNGLYNDFFVEEKSKKNNTVQNPVCEQEKKAKTVVEETTDITNKETKDDGSEFAMDIPPTKEDLEFLEYLDKQERLKKRNPVKPTVIYEDPVLTAMKRNFAKVFAGLRPSTNPDTEKEMHSKTRIMQTEQPDAENEVTTTKQIPEEIMDSMPYPVQTFMDYVKNAVDEYDISLKNYDEDEPWKFLNIAEEEYKQLTPEAERNKKTRWKEEMRVESIRRNMVNSIIDEVLKRRNYDPDDEWDYGTDDEMEEFLFDLATATCELAKKKNISTTYPEAHYMLAERLGWPAEPPF